MTSIETLRRETRRYALLARKARWMRQLADENGPMTPDEAHRTRSYGAIGIKAAASLALLQTYLYPDGLRR